MLDRCRCLVVVNNCVMLSLQPDDLINPLFEFMNIFILSLPHGLIPLIRFPFDLMPYMIKCLSGDLLVDLSFDFFNYLWVRDSLDG